MITPLSAYAEAAFAESVQNVIEGILVDQLRQAEVDHVQDWINGALTDRAGESAENYIFALVQSDETYDFSSYRKALVEMIEQKRQENVSASTMLKSALANLAVGGDRELSSALLDTYAGELGIMSWVFALHLLNNEIESQKYTVDDVIDRLLALRLSDGGWALTGQYSDVDVTAMTIQALASSYNRRDDVKNAVNEALERLASVQLSNGGFQSYGTENPESAAQVLIALSSLGVDALADERFIKDGDILDSLECFRLADGSFRHLADGAYNAMATQQVFEALIAYRMQTPFYIFEERETPSSVETTADRPSEMPNEQSDVETETTEVMAHEADEKLPAETEAFSLKWILCAVILGGVLIICVFLLLFKKRNPKNFVIILSVAALLIVLVCSLDISLPTQYYNEIGKKDCVIGSVTLSISCERLVELGETSEYIPTDGILLAACEFDLAEGESVYDITVEAARKFGIHIDAETANDYEMVYVKGIGYLYELDYGSLSGWIYQVNGVAPSVGCGAYQLKDGDMIEWRYTVDLGNDLE